MREDRLSTGGIVRGLLEDTAGLIVGWPRNGATIRVDGEARKSRSSRMSTIRNQSAFLLCLFVGLMHTQG